MTLINVILDRSGSMGAIAYEAVGMYNRFLDEQKALPDYAEFSLIQFDDKYEENYIRKPIKDVDKLILGESYKPRGMTALFDAIGKSINKIGEELKSMKEYDRPKRVLFMILTDGEENASKEFTGESIKNMISHQKEKYNWDFIFLAAGIDAFNEGSKFGMNMAKCANFDFSAKGLNSAGATMSAYTTQYRSTGDTSMKVEDYKN